MSTFSNLQNAFQEFLLHDNHDIFNNVVTSEKVSVNIRLGVYKNAYQSRLQQALAANYPVLNLYLGDEQFEKLAIAYINHYPSSFSSIRWFGDQLVNFLQESSEWKQYPYLAELAQFEWTCGLVFDAADASILQIEQMASIPADAWASIRFKAHPAVKYLDLSWNTIAIWQALTENVTPPDLQQNIVPITWLLWRKDLTCQFSSLLDDEAWALKAMLHGATFGEICESICQWHEENDAGHRAASLLKGWIITGLIIEVCE